MALPRFQFSGSWENPADFPTREYSETQVRKDMMRFFTEIETFLNRTLIPLLEAGGYSGGSGSGGDNPAGGPYLPLAGGQMVGPLLLDDNPTEPMGAATKAYVDEAGHMVQEGVDGQISALEVELGRIAATVADGLGNLTQITVEPGRVETILQDDAGRLLELLLQSDLLKAHFQTATADSGVEMSAEDFNAWWKDFTGKMAEIIANKEGIQAAVSDTAEGLSTEVEITKDGLTSTATDLLNEIKSIIAQTPGMIQEAVEGANSSSSLTLTQEQIDSIVRGINGNFAQVTVTEDEVTQTVSDGLNREAVIKLIEDKIQQYVTDGVHQAEVEIGADQIRLAVERLFEEGNETVLEVVDGRISSYISGEGGSTAVDQTDNLLRMIVAGTNTEDLTTLALTPNGLVGVVSDQEDRLSTVEQTANSITSVVQNPETGLSAVRQTANEIRQTVEDPDTGLSAVSQTAGRIVQLVGDPDTGLEALGRQYSSIETALSGITMQSVREGSNARLTLYIPNHNPVTGLVAIDANVDVSGELSADALYAQRGEVANLSVDQLDTSRRISKYLRGDTATDNFIRICRKPSAADPDYGIPVLEFVTAKPNAGSTVQAKTPDGHNLWWDTEDMTGYSVVNGYPAINGVRVFTTTTQTAYPVLTYSYTEEVKLSLKFDMVGNLFTPIVNLGAGNGDGTNKGWIVKSGDGLDIRYLSNTNREIGIRMTNDGYVDITGLRKTTGLNFSGWNSGSFTETVEGKSPTGYGVTFDAQGRPRSISQGGNTLNIQW